MVKFNKDATRSVGLDSVSSKSGLFFDKNFQRIPRVFQWTSYDLSQPALMPWSHVGLGSIVSHWRSWWSNGIACSARGRQREAMGECRSVALKQQEMRSFWEQSLWCAKRTESGLPKGSEVSSVMTSNMDDDPPEKNRTNCRKSFIAKRCRLHACFFSYPSPLYLPRLLDMFSLLETDSSW